MQSSGQLIGSSIKSQKLFISGVTLLLIGTLVFYSYRITLPYNITYFFQNNGSIFDGASLNGHSSGTNFSFKATTKGLTTPKFIPPTDPLVQPWHKCQLDQISESRHKEDGRWFNFSSPNFSLYAYSAFIDNRVSLLSETPILRVIGVTDIVNNSALDSKTDAANYSCVLYFKDSVPGKFTVKTVKGIPHPRPIGMGWGLKGRNHREFVFGCPLEYPNSTTVWPKAVGITKLNEQSAENCMPVEVPAEAYPKKDFAVCVAVTFGEINPWRLVQWFEIQRILGVSKIHIYDFGVSADALKVLRYYNDLGILELYKMTPYAPKDHQHYWLHNSPAINDCMYRNMNKFNYIIVIDVDEFILPVHQRNLTELIKYLDKVEALKTRRLLKPSLYQFLNAYYFMNNVHDNTTLLTFLRHRRVNVSPPGYSVKSIVNSQACVAMHNHYCWTTTPAHSGPAYIQINADVSIGANRHYKRCHFNKEECLKMLNSTKQNDEFRPYAVSLKDAAIPAFQKIFSRLPMEVVRNNISDIT